MKVKLPPLHNLFYVFVFLLFSGDSLLIQATAQESKRPPNILFILIDNLGKDWFDCYGSVEGATPNIDNLAEKGVRFQHCYVTPMCSTSRAVLMTGRYGFTTGWSTHHDTAIYGGGYLDWEREVVFARVLQKAGYATCITGKWQLNDLYDQKAAIARHGFDEHLLWSGALSGKGNADQRWKKTLGPDGSPQSRSLESRYYDPIIFKNGEHMEAKGEFGPALYLEYLVDFMKRNKDKPFFAFYSSPSVHYPLVATPLDPKPEDTSPHALWGGMVRYTDYQVGQLIDSLNDLGLRENTIVVLTTDNGTWSRHGGNMTHGKVKGGLGKATEAGLDVPLIVNCPGSVPSGRVSNALIDGTDFLPTFADLADAKLPTDLKIDGKSFADLIRGTGKDEDHRDWIYSQHADNRVLRNHRYKLYSSGAFFDLKEDFLEKNDLTDSEDPSVVKARKAMQTTLDGFPANAKLPFEPRSQIAFRLKRLREAGGKTKKK